MREVSFAVKACKGLNLLIGLMSFVCGDLLNFMSESSSVRQPDLEPVSIQDEMRWGLRPGPVQCRLDEPTSTRVSSQHITHED